MLYYIIYCKSSLISGGFEPPKRLSAASDLVDRDNLGC